MLVKQDTIHSSVSEDETLTNQNDGGALTQRERAEFGYFDSLQSRGMGAGRGDEAHQYGSIAVSDGGGCAELATTSRKKSTSRSPPQIGGVGRKAGGPITARCQSPSDDAGLIFLGQQVHSMQEHFDKKAERLYRGKVLIDRQRTRDIMAAKLRCGPKTKNTSNRAKFADL